MTSSWPYTCDKDFLEETIRVWQPLSKEPLSYADAEKIIRNAVGFYGTLLRWVVKRRLKRINTKALRSPSTRSEGPLWRTVQLLWGATGRYSNSG